MRKRSIYRMRLLALCIFLMLWASQAATAGELKPAPLVPRHSSSGSGNRFLGVSMSTGPSFPISPSWFRAINDPGIGFRAGLLWLAKPNIQPSGFDFLISTDFSYAHYNVDVNSSREFLVPERPRVTSEGGEVSSWQLTFGFRVRPTWERRVLLPYCSLDLGVGRAIVDDQVLEAPLLTYQLFGFDDWKSTMGGTIGCESELSKSLSIFVQGSMWFVAVWFDEEDESDGGTDVPNVTPDDRSAFCEFAISVGVTAKFVEF